MVNPRELKPGNPLVITSGDLEGTIVYFKCVYPFPEGGEGFFVELPGDGSPDGKPHTLKVYEDRVIAIKPYEYSKSTCEPREKTPVNATFIVGQRVLITKEGEWRGTPGIIRTIVPLAGGCLTDYEVEPTNQDEKHPIAIRLREEDLVPADYLKVNIKGFDIGRLLDRNTIISFAREAYEVALREHVNTVMRNRTIGNMTIVDWILCEVANRYCEELAPRFKDALLEKVKEEIARNTKEEDDPCGTSFSSMFTESLKRSAELYISTHNEEIHEIMKSQIKQAASSVSGDVLADIIRRKVNVKEILHEAFSGDTEN